MWLCGHLPCSILIYVATPVSFKHSTYHTAENHQLVQVTLILSITSSTDITLSIEDNPISAIGKKSAQLHR